jgi:hypothetical protein
LAFDLERAKPVPGRQRCAKTTQDGGGGHNLDSVAVVPNMAADVRRPPPVVDGGDEPR